MNKNAIKKFAIDARNKLIASVTDKAGMLGITPDNCSEAITTGQNDLFIRCWYEIEQNNKKWYKCNKGGGFRKWYGNQDFVIDWENDGYKLKNFRDEKGKLRSTLRSIEYNFHEAITMSRICSGITSFRYLQKGFITEGASNNIYYDDEGFKLLAFLNSKVCDYILNVYNPTINIMPDDLRKLPLTYEKFEYNFCENVKRNIELCKLDWDSFETSWDFKRHPLISVISQNRTLFDDITDIDLAECYTCWENECNERFNQLRANEEELNRIFIDIYGLQDELTPEVEDKDVTVRKADLQRDIKSLVSYAVGCMFGRYSLDEEGLVLAGQPFEAHFFEASAPVCGTGFAGASGASVPIGEFYYKTDEGVKKCTYNPDKDNIIPICDEEYFSDDIVSRFCEWVKIVYGEKSLETNLDFIAKALGNKGNTSREVIRNYFLNDFFKDHCNTYSVTGSGKRPIYWLFDSGKQNGFKALIYMHRCDADTVGRVRTDYLHKAQKYVETAMQSAQYTIDNATSASEKSKATKAVTKYTKQLAEMRIYDEAIAHVANQRIEIDLDDGVKVNYAKFQGVEVAQEGKKALKVDLLAKI